MNNISFLKRVIVFFLGAGFFIVLLSGMIENSHLAFDENHKGRLNKGCVKLFTSPFVLKEAQLYRMWHTGTDCASGKKEIYHAMSKDSIHWEKYEEGSVLKVSIQGWDSQRVGSPSVIKQGNIFHMWYRGDGLGLQQIGYAVSQDGINWEKYKENPVVRVGRDSEWDNTSLVARTLFIEMGISICGIVEVKS